MRKAVKPVMYRRVDIGWRDPGGNHGLIAIHDGQLGPAEEAALYQWTDITRGPFRTHWFFTALTPDVMALIRVSPMSGGTRGTASYGHALLLAKRSVVAGSDLGQLPTFFPDVPRRIGEQSSWHPMQPALPPINDAAHLDVENHPALLAAMLSPHVLPLTACHGIPTDGLDDEAQIVLALRTYALMPAMLRGADMHFASADVPGFARPVFLFDASLPTSHADTDLARYWLSLHNKLPIGSLDGVDVRDAKSTFRGVARSLLDASSASPQEQAGSLVHTLLAVSLGDLDDAKFSAIEETLCDTAPSAKGPLLLALLEHLERAKIEGANPLWILRLLADPLAIGALPFADRRQVLSRFFLDLPAELERIFDQLHPRIRLESIQALRQALGDSVSLNDSQPIARFLGLVDRLLRTALLSTAHPPDEQAYGLTIQSLHLMRDLLADAAPAHFALKELASCLVEQIVVDPSLFAARLLDLSDHRMAQAAGLEESLPKILQLLLEASLAVPGYRPLACLMAALQAVCRPGFPPQDALQILDGLSTALPVEDQLWIPGMKRAVRSISTGYENGKRH